ncbi:MAG TPA: hypothetical protein VK137_14280 [Planctomycetaceae bacterium]|nr:hypothetical protein [Planctomycetaceae bacterium]
MAISETDVADDDVVAGRGSSPRASATAKTVNTINDILHAAAPREWRGDGK